MRMSIKGYEGKYDVTIDGRIFSLNYNNTGKEKELKQRTNKKGRAYVNLSINGKYTSLMVMDHVLRYYDSNSGRW